MAQGGPGPALLATEMALAREAVAGRLELRGGRLELGGGGAGGDGTGGAGGAGGAGADSALYSHLCAPSLPPHQSDAHSRPLGIPAHSVPAQGWEGSWLAAAALWCTGIARLRGGVERGESQLVRQGSALLREYFGWVRQRHGATRSYMVSSQVTPTLPLTPTPTLSLPLP